MIQILDSQWEIGSHCNQYNWNTNYIIETEKIELNETQRASIDTACAEHKVMLEQKYQPRERKLLSENLTNSLFFCAVRNDDLQLYV